MSELKSKPDKDVLLQEFRALRDEMLSIVNARVWGTLTYIAVAGAAATVYSRTNDPIVFLFLIFIAPPLLWHTANRERARVRIGAYVRVVLEPQMGRPGWEEYLSRWRKSEVGLGESRGSVDRWRHILSLTGVYVVIVVFSLAVLLREARRPWVVLLALAGVALCAEAHLYLNRTFLTSAQYEETFRKAARELGEAVEPAGPAGGTEAAASDGDGPAKRGAEAQGTMPRGKGDSPVRPEGPQHP